MVREMDAIFVEQCAPTLTGIKPASLFRCQAGEGRDPRQAARRWAKDLAPFGIAVRILKECPHTGACLVYVYRAKWLRQILAEPEHAVFLRQMGYETERGCGGLLQQLSERLCLERDFPHEIGVFLGYPLEDVVGFIRYQGKCYTCSGCWKAYGNPAEAQARFDAYRRCTAECTKRFRQGVCIAGLAA